MKVADLPAPSRTAKPRLLGLEPWQIEAVERVRETFGIDGDALVRAGLTLVLGLVAQAPAHAIERLSAALASDREAASEAVREAVREQSRKARWHEAEADYIRQHRRR
jgi:hypothetical protein